MSQDLAALLETARDRRILVAGDLILDRYLFGRVARISPEAPIQVFEVGGEDLKWGGAGNVARNLVALGCPVTLCGVVGDDEEGRILREGLRAEGCNTDGVLVDPSRPTTMKTRHVAQNQQVLRVDRERRVALEEAIEARFLTGVRAAVEGADLVILSDYAKGVLTPGVTRGVIDAARSRGVPVLVDPKGRGFERYRGATVLTPNRGEAEVESGIDLDGDGALQRAGEKLLDRTGAQAVVITLGSEGVFACEREGRVHRVAAEARSVYDVTGAGDTLVAVLGLGVASGASIEASIHLANRAAGIVVGKLGAVAVGRKELEAALRAKGSEGEPRASGKLLAAADLDAVLDAARGEGKKIVFTNGCFDLLHAGHVRYLTFARAQGDRLIVGLNGDRSVARLKGGDRPLQPFEDRVAVLEGLACVDWVVGFDEDTPEALIRRVRPDVFVKGEDWRGKDIAGQAFVEAHRGRVVLAPFLRGRSTSRLVTSIRAKDTPRGRGGAGRGKGRSR